MKTTAKEFIHDLGFEWPANGIRAQYVAEKAVEKINEQQELLVSKEIQLRNARRRILMLENKIDTMKKELHNLAQIL